MAITISTNETIEAKQQQQQQLCTKPPKHTYTRTYALKFDILETTTERQFLQMRCALKWACVCSVYALV